MDNNKSLLNEATIKRFMKLASLKPLSDDFVMRLTEATGSEPTGSDDPVSESIPVAEEGALEEGDTVYNYKKVTKKGLKEGGMVYNEDEPSPEDLGGGGLDLPEEEVGEEGIPEEGAPLTLASVEAALESGLGALVARLEDGIPGLEMSVDGNGEEGLEDVEPELGVGGPPPEEVDVALAERKIVETVVARVASRLKNRVQKERIAEALTEKIFQRLTKK